MDRSTDYGGREGQKTGATGKPDYGIRGDRDSFNDGSHRQNYDGRAMDGEIDYEDLEDMWYEVQDDYRSRYPKLTDDDVKVEPGRFDRTIDHIGRRIEKSPDDVRHEIENW